MPILGLRDTSNFVTNQRPENWRETLLLLYPNSAEAAKAPLTALTSLMKSESTNDAVFHWWEKELDDRRLKLSGSYNTTDTSITVDSTFKVAKIVKAGDVLLIEQTGEHVRVAQDPTSDTVVVVTRGVGGTTATAINSATSGVNYYMTVIGSAFEEGSNAPSGVNYDPTERYNQCQIFRSTLEMTRTAEKTRLRTGDQVKEAKRECLEYIGVDMERAFWFGTRASTTLNGKPLRYTDGVIKQITDRAAANVHAVTGANGALDLDEFENHLEAAFRYGSSEKMGFTSNLVLMYLNKMVRRNTSYNIQNNIKEFGMAVTRFTTPFGELILKAHPLFNQMRGGTNTTAFLGVANNLYILDQSNIKYRYVDDLKYEPKLAENDLDGMKSGYLAECGIELHHAKSHYILTGIQSGVADF